MTNSRSSTASASREKKDKRPFERLSLDEKDALKTLYAAKGHAVTASGGMRYCTQTDARSQAVSHFTGLCTVYRAVTRRLDYPYLHRRKW
ncbi:MAG: hypothetical protein JWM07_517 [Candidatus Saccharibacteria bacterium]|nr:hypothetical protein [Candidatus Saccharibacteria bacterium]